MTPKFSRSILVLDKESITYEIYQEERKIITHKRALMPTHDEPRRKRKLEEM